MNKACLLITIFIFFSFILEAQKLHLQSIKISYVNFALITMVDIPCSEFETAFNKKDYQIKYISDSSWVKEFDFALGTTRISSSNKNINVKAILYLKYDRGANILCVSKFYEMELNGRSIEKNYPLENLLKKIIN